MRKIESVDPVEEVREIWTVGHSTHALEDFTLILKSHSIETLADVRAYPASRRYPHFNQDTLRESLRSADIAYYHLPSLGGRRTVTRDSKNTAWKNASFRAYADYMETEKFREGMRQLTELSSASRTAIMCAEAVWWRCHRSLIADYLKARDWTVTHILNEKKTELHPYTSAASIIDGQLSYSGLLREGGLEIEPEVKL